MMTTSEVGRPDSDAPTTYEVRLAGHLDDRWSHWSLGHTLVHLEDATTTLTIEVTDQSQLHGLLAGIRDLGVKLLSVNEAQVTGKTWELAAPVQDG